MIRLKQRGNFNKTTAYLERIKNLLHAGLLDKYGREGVNALRAATPTSTGLTAASWSYRITNTQGRIALEFCNSNFQNGVPIAIILQYGHGTGTGGWVEGRDYINPAIQPIFDNLAAEAWKEVERA